MSCGTVSRNSYRSNIATLNSFRVRGDRLLTSILQAPVSQRFLQITRPQLQNVAELSGGWCSEYTYGLDFSQTSLQVPPQPDSLLSLDETTTQEA
jgi:hypothetical protein